MEPTHWCRNDVSLPQAATIARKLHSACMRSGFNVTYQDVLAKLAESENLLLGYEANQGLAGFAGYLDTRIVPVSVAMPFARLRYACGVIVDPKFERRGFCTSMLRMVARGTDLVVAHTQSSRIMRAFDKAFPYLWPRPEGSALLKPAMAASLASFFESIERPTVFDRASGLVRNCYPSGLYTNQDDRDGYVVIGFTNKTAYAEAIEEVENVAAA